jgi:ATP-dependent Lhr-like helicase
MERLVADARATTATGIWIATERIPQLRAAIPGASLQPDVALPPRIAEEKWSAEDAGVELLRGRLSLTGPVTADRLAVSSGMTPAAIDVALANLESQGFAMRGRFTPGVEDEEWCERGLLARIHRYTMTRLRREIEPVSKADFTRFLSEWQRVKPTARAKGAESVAVLLAQLEGFSAPAGAWEGEILPARIEKYDPMWLDALCLSGRYTWARARGVDPETGSGSKPIATTPITLVSRGSLGAWQRSRAAAGPGEFLSAEARAVHTLLDERGACFFDEIMRRTGLLRTQVENSLGELVGAGEVTSDSFTGLRALLTPSDRRPPIGRRGKRSTAVFGMENAGRWSLLRDVEPAEDVDSEYVARTLLRRYGVVCRRLLVRDSLAPPWRDLLAVYRRLEARGEIRGGRFVDGFSGEQFALTEAVGRLRSVRRETPSGEWFSISAADPMNLSGVTLSGSRIPGLSKNRLLLRDGVCVASYVAGEVHYTEEMDPARQWEARKALLRRRVPPQLRAYLGRSA